MTCMHMSETEMKEKSCFWTATEIHQQPATWLKTMAQIKNEKEQLKAFIEKVTQNPDFDVILTGAGTSEFVGNSIALHLGSLLDKKVRSIGTTDLVSAPEEYFFKDKPTLLISFARSGNSPESVGVVEAAETVCKNLSHLMITCNKEGALSLYAEGKSHAYALNLCEETCDQSFAMTSSYTNMALACILCFHLDELEKMEETVKMLAESGSEFLEHQLSSLESLVKEFDFKRIVYLGANDLKGCAQESALKMLELTAGKVVTMHDSPLGFRHGPKSIVDDDTLCVMLMNSSAYSRQYEMDLLKEMSVQRKHNRIAVVCSQPLDQVGELADEVICFHHADSVNNAFLALNYILFAQSLALLKSLSLSITPDNPCPSGEVNRVVKGVVIYPYHK